MSFIMSATDDQKVTLGNYLALAFAVVFFSGLLQSSEWYGVFDFTTLNGTFGSIADGFMFRGKGGSGARDGFLFALTLVPTCMFALGMINVLEHYGALKAARKLLTPLLRPLMGLPGSAALAMIGSLQNTDTGAGLTKKLVEEGELNQEESEVFTAFQFSAGATIVNFFSSGAVLFTLTNADGSLAVPTSIGLTVGVMFIFKIIGANVLRLILKAQGKKVNSQAKVA
ncbi:nucleoside recognition domain-containing protein [Endozoicomonas euniceicola]|uniref:YjiH family protein n=1 Tax=Endozoicomonas euniceicola TaxID=1234143 RepID=A0ABY6GPE0_9GAMM|nr:nucleoside recognition domain-containing protein [Endozoicomonas euniceicola]UYM14565.1 YjiH family protein [Endozoicomonas euniceicola]